MKNKKSAIIHQQEDLAKFGFKPEKTVFFNKKKFFYILATCWNFADLEFYVFSKSGELGAFFFTKILSMCQNHIFRLKKCEKSPFKKKH
jgi:hypothetical protein